MLESLQKWTLPALLAGLLAAGPASAEAQEPQVEAQVPVETFQLDNGMTFLLVHKPELTTVAAGWVAHVGSANERPGITGITHLFEHMMFKGTRTLGTEDIARDLQIIAEQEELQRRIRELYELQKERWRRGEIADPYAPEARPPELVELEKEFQELVDKQRELMVKNEFDKIYTREGGSRMNAFTNQDMTAYFITVPENKLELWFWMESDRLRQPVLREFYAERDVVHEERRLRTESTPTGKFDEQFNAMFWQSHPYGWPVIGWPSDLRAISKEDADRYYDTFYGPNNVTAALVGDFDRQRVRELAEAYFGRIPRSEQNPPEVVTLEMPQLAEKRMVASCDCQPQIEVRYHTVPFRHEDSYALDVLSGLLRGRTGRLYKAMVLDQEIASQVGAAQVSNKWAGYFSFSAETKGESTPEQLEQAWYQELSKLIEQPITGQELQKVKNQIVASSFRRLQNPFFLMIQLLYYDGLGDWTYINDWADKTLAVTADDVKRAAKEYLTQNNRMVGLYYREEGTEAEPVPEELAELPPQAQRQIMSQVEAISGIEDPSQLEQILAQLQQQKEMVPPQFQKAVEYVEKKARARLAELQGGATGEGDDGGEEEAE
jgi:predicted Zn-dependent peptidase